MPPQNRIDLSCYTAPAMPVQFTFFGKQLYVRAALPKSSHCQRKELTIATSVFVDRVSLILPQFGDLFDESKCLDWTSGRQLLLGNDISWHLGAGRCTERWRGATAHAFRSDNHASGAHRSGILQAQSGPEGFPELYRWPGGKDSDQSGWQHAAHPDQRLQTGSTCRASALLLTRMNMCSSSM